MNISQQYLRSIYYVIKIVTGVGQGDMIAYNDIERIAFCLIINIGDAFFAICFGLISQLQIHIFEISKDQSHMRKLREVQ